jgi:hypothetical protein
MPKLLQTVALEEAAEEEIQVAYMNLPIAKVSQIRLVNSMLLITWMDLVPLSTSAKVAHGHHAQ